MLQHFLVVFFFKMISTFLGVFFYSSNFVSVFFFLKKIFDIFLIVFLNNFSIFFFSFVFLMIVKKKMVL